MRIVALGRPAPQGSKRYVGKGISIESSKRTKPWRERVHHAAIEALDGAPRIDSACTVTIIFYFDRPRSHYRTGRNAHLLRDAAPTLPTGHGNGDIEKLQRACFDSLTTAGVWKDDSQVWRVYAEKRFCGEVGSSLDKPGVVIDVYSVDTAAGAV